MTGVGEGLVANLATEASKGLFILAKRHAGHCFQFKKYVESFQTELESLKLTRNDALERKKSSEKNNEEITDVAMNWFGKAKDLIHASEEINKKMEKKSKCFLHWCPNCVHQYDLGKKAAKMATELNRHSTNFKYDNFSRHAPHLVMEFHASMNFVDLEGRKVACDQLWKALQDDKISMIGVYAMGGSGKTTLLQELGFKAEKEKLFEKVVFVVVSNSPDIRKIQENIASQLGLTFVNSQESDRAVELWLRLTKGDKILLILDDVWEKLNLKAIGIPFKNKHKGCIVVFTTRKVNVCSFMECQLKIELSVLTTEDTWKLFQKYANISNDPSIPILDVAKEIASKCKGLPLAIATVASTLKNKEPQVWVDALTTLKNAKQLIGIDENLKEIYKCLRLSYDNLEREVQDFFLLCSLFPEDYEIPVDLLVRLAIGLHLFGDDCSFMNARRMALEAKRRLVDSCLLLNVKSNNIGEFVQMHDLIREVGQWIATKETEVAQWIATKETKEITRSIIDKDALNQTICLWLKVTDNLPNQLIDPQLKILMILVEMEAYISFDEKEEFFRGLDNLRVVVLNIDCFGRKTIKLPPSIQVLKGLRVLQLNGWKLGNISFIGSLKSLESLELRMCEIDELPNSMVELKYLRLLDLVNCIMLQSPFELIGKLAQLEELYYFFSTFLSQVPSWEVDGENISNFWGKNCQLTRYRIQIGNTHYLFNNHFMTSNGSLSIGRVHPSTSNATIKNLVGRA